MKSGRKKFYKHRTNCEEVNFSDNENKQTATKEDILEDEDSISQEGFPSRVKKREKLKIVRRASTDSSNSTMTDNSKFTELENSSILNLKKYTGLRTCFSKQNFKQLYKRLHNEKKISVALFEKLNSLDIKITWKLPYLHKHYDFIYNFLYYVRDKPVIDKKKIKEGRFKTYENEYIFKRWSDFCKLYDFNEKEDFCFFLPKVCHISVYPLGKTQKLKFCQFIAQDMPKRMLHTVYARFVNMFKYYKKGFFSQDEIDLMIYVYNNAKGNPRIYSILATLLHRSRFCIYSKLRRVLDKIDPTQLNVSAKDKENSVREDDTASSSNESTKESLGLEILQNAMLQVAGTSKDVNELDNVSRKKWKLVGKRCNLPPAQAKILFLCSLRTKAVHTGTKLHNCSSLLSLIIHSLKKHQWRKWKLINWNQLSEEIFNLGPVFLYYIFRKCIKRYVPQERWKKLNYCITYFDENPLTGKVCYCVN